MRSIKLFYKIYKLLLKWHNNFHTPSINLTSSDRIRTNFGLFWSLRSDGHNGNLFTILRLVDPEIFTSETFVLFPTKILLCGDGVSTNKANSASCDPILTKFIPSESSHLDEHDGGIHTFLRAIGHILFAFKVSDPSDLHLLLLV